MISFRPPRPPPGAAADDLAEDREVGGDAERFLRPAERDAKTLEHSSKTTAPTPSSQRPEPPKGTRVREGPLPMLPERSTKTAATCPLCPRKIARHGGDVVKGGVKVSSPAPRGRRGIGLAEGRTPDPAFNQHRVGVTVIPPRELYDLVPPRVPPAPAAPRSSPPRPGIRGGLLDGGKRLADQVPSPTSPAWSPVARSPPPRLDGETDRGGACPRIIVPTTRRSR